MEDSVFSGQKYGNGNNGGGNTQKAYKSKCDIGSKTCSGSGPNKNKNKMEKQLDGVAVVKADPKKYNDEILWPDKVRINLEYYRNRSFWGDIALIFKTIFKKGEKKDP